jgi:hypothetical protein
MDHHQQEDRYEGDDDFQDLGDLGVHQSYLSCSGLLPFVPFPRKPQFPWLQRKLVATLPAPHDIQALHRAEITPQQDSNLSRVTPATANPVELLFRLF